MYVFPSFYSPAKESFFFLCGVVRRWCYGSGVNVREIGDVDKGVVEGGEDTGYTKDELACTQDMSVFVALVLISHIALAV